ncbi:biliverdin-producing heme oxygenase [Pseudomonas sp. S31]|uniref:biliverdin-producing heme oxygenase n=1 Tax=Pseudomonas sp. S31 TaxID=1564473 RepID=UPI001911EB58|nr:biliverdin-producing heme oxygenase [Pseudomonas sp. S31]MBK4998691.1 biliverdin-producing heme oxygenase [Pseudomonas sp. S31]
MSTRPTPSPLLLALRAGTRACHTALEERLPFFREGFDVAGYRRLLSAYYGFHAPLELTLAGYQGVERAKAPALVRDLLALGLSAADIDALPLCQALPAVEDEARALGVMYVLEGSTLGGQVLKRAMAERLGLAPDRGLGFLDVYGAASGSYWRAFLERLADAACTQAAQAATVQAAIDTFVCFERWLAQRGVLDQANTCTTPHAGTRATNPAAVLGQ